MPSSIFSRFNVKKSPSSSSSLGELEPDQSIHFSEEDPSSKSSLPQPSSITRSPLKTGSLFVEDLLDQDQNQFPGQSQDHLSPVKRTSAISSTGTLTPTNKPLDIPGSNQKIGTPRLVLTTDDTSSPKSLSDNSPITSNSGLVGLGLGTSPERYKPTKMNGDSGHQRYTTAPELSQPLPAHPSGIQQDIISLNDSPLHRSPSKDDRRNRSGSVLSGASLGSDGTHSRRESVAARVNSLLPVDSRLTSKSDKSKKSKKSKSRRGSHSSSLQNGIAGALAKSGLAIASGHGHHEDLNSAASANSTTSTSGSRHHRAPSTSNARSPFLTRGKVEEDDASYLRGDGDDEASARHEVVYDDDDGEDDDDDDEDDSDDHSLPVTGFAVASNRRNADFHALFPTVDEGDYLIEDYGCALSKDILIQGRLYVSENHLCFHANIFGWVTDVVTPFSEIKTIDKKMTALVIPNAIGIVTNESKYTLASFISRDTTYDVMMNIWRLSHPNAVMSSFSLASRPGSIAGEDPPNTASTRSTSGTARNGGPGPSPANGGVNTGANGGVGKSGKGHKATTCQCGKDGKHYGETASEATFPSSPEKVYNLMFNSGWYKTFLSDNQKLRDVEQSDWRPSEISKHLSRSTSYIKPLNGSIGPKQTKCHIVDEQEHVDFDQYISMLTTTRTPDVPSGGVFSVKTRTCFMWAGGNHTRVVVTTTVEWTGKSWVKGIIEKSCIEGQKSYHDDLAIGMRSYMKAHHTEFAGEGNDDDDDDCNPDSALQTTTNTDDKDGQTEAEAYAAKARRQRQEQDYTYLQGAIDTVWTGFKGVFSGLKIIYDTLTDLFSDSPISKETIMGLIIFILVISNIYTYFKVGVGGSGKEERKARRLSRSSGGGGEGDGEMAEAVKLLLQAQVGRGMGSGGGGGERDSPLGEARELQRIIGDVERRLERLKGSMASSVRGSEDGPRTYLN